MNRTGFEELEMQVQQSGLSLKSYLRQIGVSYSTYHYWLLMEVLNQSLQEGHV